jgi:hypothetical protein
VIEASDEVDGNNDMDAAPETLTELEGAGDLVDCCEADADPDSNDD